MTVNVTVRVCVFGLLLEGNRNAPVGNLDRHFTKM